MHTAPDGWRPKESLTAARRLGIDIKSGDVDNLGAGGMPNWFLRFRGIAKFGVL
ncbi:MAG TPA: hypothetical protein VMM76_22750 [Pirellulaceae bacterium]|nr:hypothetical protein [Pirellulaceae bacterium]